MGEVKHSIELGELSDRRIAIDAYNTIYQFLSIIRQPDGTPLSDSKGNVTSHLSGLFYRTINLLENRVTPIFIFDGIPPVLKRRTLEARARRRDEAMQEWEEAKKKGMVEEARTYAMASTRINKQIVDDSKRLLDLMGIPYIQAPGEGEAQAAQLSRDDLVYASASQDYDSFLFGANIVIRNMTITGKRKLPGKNVYVNVNIERVELWDLLRSLEVNQRQLIWIGMLMGTDFNSGINGVGPKTALKMVKNRDSINDVFDYAVEKYKIALDFDPEEVEGVFLSPEVEKLSRSRIDEIVKEARPSKEGIVRFLCDEHEFSEDRVSKYADKILSARGERGQKGINSWL